MSSGTSVATASGSDADDSASLTYSITSGNDAGKFAINSSTGAITTAATLDYETTTSYTLVIAASDGTLTTTTSKTINISDIDDGNNNPVAVDDWGTIIESNYPYESGLNIFDGSNAELSSSSLMFRSEICSWHNSRTVFPVDTDSFAILAAVS